MIISRPPRNRPTVNKCLDSQWLAFNESMVTSRQSRVFTSERLRAFTEIYEQQRVDPTYRADTVDIGSLPKVPKWPDQWFLHFINFS